MTQYGRIGTYVHHDGRSGAIVEVRCETDFVSGGVFIPGVQAFYRLVADLALHVVAAAPRWIRRDEVPVEVVEETRRRLLGQGPERRTPGILKDADRRLGLWYREVVLMDQPFARDPSKTVADLLAEVGDRLGERLSVVRFARFAVGEPWGGPPAVGASHGPA